MYALKINIKHHFWIDDKVVTLYLNKYICIFF